MSDEGGCKKCPFTDTSTYDGFMRWLTTNATDAGALMLKKQHAPKDEPYAEPIPNDDWIEIQLVTEDDAPVAGETVVIRASGSTYKGQTDADGLFRADKIRSGKARVTVESLDERAWGDNRWVEKDAASSEPVVATHVVQQGDCLNNIAAKYGLLPKTIWSHAENKKLRELRKSENVLFPGDEVKIPKKGERWYEFRANQRVKVFRKGLTTVFHVQLDGPDFANKEYIFDVDGVEHKGTTDADSNVREVVPADAKYGTLTIGEVKYGFKLGHLDPVTEQSGIVSRLRSLGFYLPDPTTAEDLEGVIGEFQELRGLTVTGKADEATLAEIEKEYGC